jgi:hypothetical protein
MEVVQLREGRPPLTDIPGRLRLLADQIEAGEHGDVAGALVLLPRPSDYPSIFGFGDVEGENHPMIVCELAKHVFITHRLNR